MSLAVLRPPPGRGRAGGGGAREGKARLVRSPAAPHAPDEPEEFRPQFHIGLEKGVPITLPLGDERFPAGAPARVLCGADGRLVQGPPQERPPGLGDPPAPAPLPRLDRDDVQAPPPPPAPPLFFFPP